MCSPDLTLHRGNRSLGVCFTEHATERMSEMAVSLDSIRAAVAQPDCIRPGNKRRTRMLDRGDLSVVVGTCRFAPHLRVITVLWRTREAFIDAILDQHLGAGRRDWAIRNLPGRDQLVAYSNT